MKVSALMEMGGDFSSGLKFHDFLFALDTIIKARCSYVLRLWCQPSTSRRTCCGRRAGGPAPGTRGAGGRWARTEQTPGSSKPSL